MPHDDDQLIREIVDELADELEPDEVIECARHAGITVPDLLQRVATEVQARCEAEED